MKFCQVRCLLLLTTVTLVTPFHIFTTTEIPKSSTNVYNELKQLVPKDIYEALTKIYANKNLLVVDKLKELDDVFMKLDEKTLSKLPTPKAFQNLKFDLQEKVRQTYYSKTMKFEDKLKAIEDIMKALSSDQLKSVPLQVDLPGLIDFKVNVDLLFNGQIETYLLRDYLTLPEFQKLESTLKNSTLSEDDKTHEVGKIMRNAYERDPVNFPMPLNDETLVPEAIKRLGIHMMFSKNPFESIEKFSNVLKTLGDKKSDRRRNTVLTNYNKYKDWFTFLSFIKKFRFN